MPTKVFIAHAEAEQDKKIVDELKAVLCGSLQCPTQDVFLSSDHESIKSYEEFPDAIRRAMREAAAVIVVVTPNSVWRPWVHFEAGGAYFHPDKRLFVVTALGIGPDSIPANVLFKSVRDLSHEPAVTQLIDDLGQTLQPGKAATIAPGSLATLVQKAAHGRRGWKLVQPAGVATKTAGSPLELLPLLLQTRQLAFVAGQNLYTLTKGKLAGIAEDAVFSFLAGDGTRKVQILIQDPAYEAGCSAWTSMQTDFGRDLGESAKEFWRWLRRAKDEGINQDGKRRLDIKVTTLVPVSFSFFDPDDPQGVMVCTTVLWRNPQAELRPAFFLTGGTTNEVLRYYWDTWRLHFEASSPLNLGQPSFWSRLLSRRNPL